MQLDVTLKERRTMPMGFVDPELLSSLFLLPDTIAIEFSAGNRDAET
jgi:hypothetical protein